MLRRQRLLFLLFLSIFALDRLLCDAVWDEQFVRVVIQAFAVPAVGYDGVRLRVAVAVDLGKDVTYVVVRVVNCPIQMI